MEDLVNLDLLIDTADLGPGNAQLMKLVEFLSPSRDGNGGEYVIKKMAGGYANEVFQLSFSSSSASFVIRVFRSSMTSIVSRNKEIAVQWLLSKNNGLAASILCRFSNGICYRYIDGEPMKREWVLDSFDQSLLVSEKMAAMHDIDCSSLDSYKGQETTLWPTLGQYIDYLEENFPDAFKLERVRANYGSVEKLRHLLKEIQDNVDKYKGQPACYLAVCHNDLLFSNMVFTDEKKDNFRFIDFEYADINYCSFDIGNFFCEYAGTEPLNAIDYSRYPSYDYQIAWLKHYLKHRNFAKTLPNDEIERLAMQFYVVVQKLSLVSHLYWALVVLIQSQAIIGSTYDYIGYGSIRMAELARRKDQVLALDQ